MFTRRQLLRRAGGGIGLLGLAALLQDEGLLDTAASADDDPAGLALGPMAPRTTHFPAKAKRVIWLFINGGPSQVDTWDYKPALAKWDGKSIREFDPTFKDTTGFFKDAVGGLMKSPFRFAPRGQSGKMVSEIFPNLGKHVDKMAFVHSAFGESNNHSPALFMMNTGMPRMGFPCVGSWVTYGLGSMSQNLPGFVVMSDPRGRGLPKGSAANWGAAFLPGVYQGTHLHPKGMPIDNLERPAAQSDDGQRAELDLIKQLNQLHHDRFAAESELSARIESFELAYRMQSAAPEAIDVDAEPDHVKALYGLDDPRCDHVARQCLVARRDGRKPRRSVRADLFRRDGEPEALPGTASRRHSRGNHEQFAGETDKPRRRALLTDLGPCQAAFSTTRWSSGVASSAACRSPKKVKNPGATTTRTGSASGWPAAASRAASATARPTRSATPPPSTGPTSTTSTPRSCTC